MVAKVENGDDIRMLQAGRDLGFSKKSVTQPLVARSTGLDGDIAAQDRVMGAVDLAKTTGADFLEQAVLAEIDLQLFAG